MVEHARELARRIDLRGSFALQLLAAKDDLVHARNDGYDDLWALAALLTSENTDRAQRWAEAVWFASGSRARSRSKAAPTRPAPSSRARARRSRASLPGS